MPSTYVDRRIDPYAKAKPSSSKGALARAIARIELLTNQANVHPKPYAAFYIGNGAVVISQHHCDVILRSEATKNLKLCLAGVLAVPNWPAVP